MNRLRLGLEGLFTLLIKLHKADGIGLWHRDALL